MSGAPSVETIEDPEDPRLADYREIRDAERRRRDGTFIAEGRQVVRRLLSAGRYRVRSALVTPPALHALGEALAAAGAPTYLVRQDIVEAVVGMEFHHGCLAAGERGAEPTAEAVLAEALRPRLVVLEGLGDSSNVGALFRNALAFGVGAVFLAPGTADPLYRKAIRVSSGATVALPFARLADWPRDLERLRDAGYTVLALTPRAEAVDIGELGNGGELGAGRPLPARVALLLGTEGRGLSAEALAAADLQVRIPMAPEMDSLNVAAAGAVALHWLSRLESNASAARRRRK
ncbi:MAG: RNA methyltransferase [Candidatus Rokubacteria bacterium]|nr:RNA methyltransferase [Candidatus Rokubacteria bacterium]